jgi:GAF domain-containing protein
MNKTIGGILLLDEEKQELRYVVHRGLSAKYVREMHPRFGEGIAGKVAQTGEALVSEDILVDTRAVFPHLIVSEGLRAFASVPLSAKNKVLGAINIASLKPYQFSPRDMQLLTGIAAQVAIAVENAKLHEEVRHQDTTRGELLLEIFSIQEEERKRIARELHD